MTTIGPANSRSIATVDQNGVALADASTNVIGIQRGAFNSGRVVWALPFGQSGLKRYLPDHDPSELCNFGMDFSFVVPYGVGLTTPALTILVNTANPSDGTADWVVGPLAVFGRTIYAQLSGGVVGTDYILRWSCSDTAGNNWVRNALVLCAHTS